MLTLFVLVSVAVLCVELVHSPGVNKEDEKEADDRSLLSHPESEGSCANIWNIGVEPVTEKNSTAEADSEPYQK